KIEGTEGAQSAPFEPLDTKKRGVDLSSGKGGEPSSPPALEAPAPKEDNFPPLQAITDPKSVYPEITEDEQEGKEALVPDTDNDVLKENSFSAGEGIQAAPIREPSCQAHQVLEKMPEPRSADQGLAIPGESCHHVGEVPAHLVGSFSEAAREASGLVRCGNQFGPPPEYEKE
ncbi:hypothetical protein U1Q18_040719, partial [Sarracenia purpurea var. burkii]